MSSPIFLWWSDPPSSRILLWPSIPPYHRDMCGKVIVFSRVLSFPVIACAHFFWWKALASFGIIAQSSSQMTTILTGKAVLTLYRHLLRSAVTAPSKKRDSIVKEIQNGTQQTRFKFRISGFIFSPFNDMYSKALTFLFIVCLFRFPRVKKWDRP